MNLLSDLFSDIFARRDNPLSRLDPRAKLIVAATALLFVIFSTSSVLPLVLLVGCVVATVAVGVPARFVAMRLTAPLGIASVLFILQAVLTGGTVWWSLNLWGWKIAISREGLRMGFLMASRVLGAMSVLQLLSSVTPAHRLFLGLRSLGVPRGWIEVALLMYRYIFTLVELTADLTAAQRLRLGYSSLRRGLSAAGVVAGMVILRSVDQAGRTAEAMRVRGYRGDIPMGTLPAFARRDGWAVALSLGVMGGLYWMVGRS